MDMFGIVSTFVLTAGPKPPSREAHIFGFEVHPSSSGNMRNAQGGNEESGNARGGMYYNVLRGHRRILIDARAGDIIHGTVQTRLSLCQY